MGLSQMAGQAEGTMKITYDQKNDLLYIRIDPRKQQLENIAENLLKTRVAILCVLCEKKTFHAKSAKNAKAKTRTRCGRWKRHQD